MAAADGISRNAFAALQGCSVFESVSEGTLHRLAKMARLETYHDRTLLVANHNVPDFLRYVQEGRVDLSLNSEDGRAASLPIGTGRWATWLGCMVPEPIEHEMWSSAGSSYISFPATEIRKAIEDNPAALRKVIVLIGATTRLLIGWSLASTLFTPDKRVAYALLAISRDGEMAGESVRLTQEQIGQMGLGSRQRVSRILHTLQNRGLIEIGYGVVVLTSPKRLAAFVFGDIGPNSAPAHPGIRIGQAN